MENTNIYIWNNKNITIKPVNSQTKTKYLINLFGLAKDIDFIIIYDNKNAQCITNTRPKFANIQADTYSNK